MLWQQMKTWLIMKLPRILVQPKRPDLLPPNAKWLAGEGAGSWFVITEKESVLHIIRYSPKGDFECENYFDCNSEFQILEAFHLDYPSHCAVVTIKQNGKKIRLHAIN